MWVGEELLFAFDIGSPVVALHAGEDLVHRDCMLSETTLRLLVNLIRCHDLYLLVGDPLFVGQLQRQDGQPGTNLGWVTPVG